MESTGSSESPIDKSRASEAQSRVCDTCRIRKCKCSNERPACASCRDNGWQCTYSLKRKRPGPVPGSRRKKHPGSTTMIVKDGEVDDERSLVPVLPNLIPEPATFAINSTLDQASNGLSGISGSSSASLHTFQQLQTAGSSISPSNLAQHNEGSLMWFTQNIQQLVTLYFEHIHVSYPFLRRSDFETQEQLDQTPRFLLFSMAALAVRFMPRAEFKFSDCQEQLELAASLARLATQDLESRSDMDLPISITEVEATFLLTLFAYTRRPGRRALEQTGRLARIAYTYGLHVVDESLESDAKDTSPEIEETDLKRKLWWSIWRMDTYAGVATGTPFNIDRYDNSTQLPGRPEGIGKDRIKARVALIWPKLIAQEEPYDSQTLINMFIAANSLVRDGALVPRLHKSGTSHSQLVKELQSSWSLIQKETPLWFWDPRMQESKENALTHGIRLQVLLQYDVLTLTSCFPPVSLALRGNTVEHDTSESDSKWQTVIRQAEKVVYNFRQWQRQYFLRSEPFTCFFAWVAAIIFKLECFRLGDENLIDKTVYSGYIEALEMVLNEFASAWELASLLSESLQHIKLVTGSNLSTDTLIKLVAGTFGPLNPKQTHLTPDLKPGPEFYEKINSGSSPEQLYSLGLSPSMFNLSDNVLNFTFQSPFLDGLVNDWQFSFS